MFQITLAAARVNAGFTQEEVANLAHKSKTTIANWESGKTEIDQANLAYLCELYRVPIDFISLPSNLSKNKFRKETDNQQERRKDGIQH